MPQAAADRAARAAPLLEVRALRRAFGDHLAVDGVDLLLPEGGSLGVVGGSGSGKTTLARVVVGLERADTGQVLVRGLPRTARVRGAAARTARAREVQMVFQDPYHSLDPRASATDALREALTLHFPDRDPAPRIRELLDQVGLGPRAAEARPRELSGGQCQRVAIARALAVEPALLVLDEAVAALDVSVQAQILNLLAEIRERTRIGCLFITHDLGVVRQVTDELVVMRDGAVVERGPTERVLAAPEHPYTRLLRDCVPQPGWDPAALAAARRAL
ncbi:ABC transporter ATP-binding protein (plasmid) [Streptomyces sp. BI20]|uniref:ABC transporter ATP-binding protein n=1 Tax=Streptomyces sp. BI20 TaxID=3403460 RepID=UPI003C731B1E